MHATDRALLTPTSIPLWPRKLPRQLDRMTACMSARWIRRCANLIPGRVRNAAWRWSPLRSRRRQRAPNTSARCTPKSCGRGPVPARSVGWLWNRGR
jgi:hypothetical protein